MHNSKKRSPWIKSILFVGILFTLIQIFNYFPRQTSHKKNGNFWPYFYQEIPENSLDIVFMGNSHSKTTFIPEIIDKLLGTQSVHVNTSGESIYQTAYEFREVTRYQDDATIVLETFPIYSGLLQDELKPWNFSFFYSMPFSLRKLLYGFQFFSSDDLLKFILPFTSNHADWKNPNAALVRVKEGLGAIKEKMQADGHIDLPYKGYENYLRSLPPQTSVPFAPIPAACSIADLEARLAAAEEIMQISRERGQKLTLIEAPQYLNQYENCSGQVIDLSVQYDIPYHTLLKEHYQSPLWFADDQHMTQFGAIIASVETARILADQLDIAWNKEMLAYYRSYFFLDYTLVQEEDSVTLTLIPEDLEAIQDVDFTWTVSLEGEAFSKTEEKGMNSVSFSLPQPTGSYFIHVVIHNPISDYYLRGGFNLVLE
jgi:hypothetical protein